MDTATAHDRHVLPTGPDAGSRARAVVREFCTAAGIDGNGTEIALLLAHELVANAAEHGSGLPVLDLAVDDSVLRVAVTDADDTPPAPSPPSDELTERGRGLLLVSSLSAGWGVDTVADGKTVWCEIDITTESESSSVA